MNQFPGEGAMHRQNRAIGGAGVGIGEGEGSAGGKSWAWKMFSWIVLSIFVYIFFLLLSGDFADHSKFHARKSVKALYLMSQTMTGVGYGDMVPKTERSKGFLRRFRKVVNFFRVSEDRFRVVMAVAAPALCVGVGCIGFHFLGKKSWENAMYLSVVSVTTVGYGEVTVETAGARPLPSPHRLFDEMLERDTVSWNTILDGYVNAGQMNEAFEFFEKMPQRMLSQGGLRFRVSAKPWIMARMMFDRMPFRNLVPWIISGYVEKGLVKDAITLYDHMEEAGLKLDNASRVFHVIAKKDLVSWNAMLQGLAMNRHVFVEECLQAFNTMEWEYRIVPGVEHYGCMIDLLGLGGRLREAFRLAHSMPMEPNAAVWGTILGACRMHNDLELAEEAGDWVNVANVRLQMRSTGVQKFPRASSDEVDDEVHEFTVFDKLHPKSDKVYGMIDRLHQDFKQLNVSLRSISNGIGG
ncbi:hypothetical protein ACFX2G_046196 [Malus domestica]